MAAKAILNPMPSDFAIVDTLVPSSKGVPCGPGCVSIPSDWHTRLLAGQNVPGCSYDIVVQNDIDASLLVSDLAQARMNNSAYNAGINAQDLSDFQARLNPKKVCMAGDSMWHGGYVLPSPAGGTHPDGCRPATMLIADPRGRCVCVGWQNQTSDNTDGNNLASRPTWRHSAHNGAKINMFHYPVNMGLYGAINDIGQPGINPDVIAFSIGTNDAGDINSGTITLAQFQDRYRQVINGKTSRGDPLNGWHTRCPNAVFVLMKPAKLVATQLVANGHAAQLQQIHDTMDTVWDNLLADDPTLQIIRGDLDVLLPDQPTAPYGGDYADDGVHARYTQGTNKQAAAWGPKIAAALALIGGP